MSYPSHILTNERVPAKAEDVETFIRHALSKQLIIVKKRYLDDTGRRFALDFYDTTLLPNGQINIHWGEAILVSYSDSTEITLARIEGDDDDWYVKTYENFKKRIEKQLGRLAELSHKILERYSQPTKIDSGAADVSLAGLGSESDSQQVDAEIPNGLTFFVKEVVGIDTEQVDTEMSGGLTFFVKEIAGIDTEQVDTVMNGIARENTVQSVLEMSKKTIPLGAILYKAAKDVIAMSPDGFMPEIDSLSPSEKNSRIVMGYAFSLVTREAKYDPEAEKEFFKSGLFDPFIPKFAKEFLFKFPTPESAVKQFNRPISFDFQSADARAVVEKILNLTVEEASALVNAKPLIMEFKEKLSSQSKVQVGAAQPEKLVLSNSLQAKWNAMGDETKSNFRKAWRIWERMRREYRREFSDGQTKNAQPKIKDWQTKVMEDLHWDVSESRLRDVKEMGEAGVIR